MSKKIFVLNKKQQLTGEFFDSEYLYLYTPKLSEERTKNEVDFLEKFVFEPNVKTVIDIPCGFGRHSLALAKRGYKVHGVDNSPIMLKEARKRSSKLPEKVSKRLTYEKADMRTYDGGSTFDASLSLFSSLGYFDDSTSNQACIDVLVRGVKKGGLIIIDVRNPIKDINDFSKNNWQHEENQEGVIIKQKLDPVSLKHTITYIYTKNGKKKEKKATWRYFKYLELEKMLNKAGASVFKTFGNFKGEPYTSESRRLILVAKKNE